MADAQPKSETLRRLTEKIALSGPPTEARSRTLQMLAEQDAGPQPADMTPIQRAAYDYAQDQEAKRTGQGTRGGAMTGPDVEGVDFWTRLKAGFKFDDQARHNFLREEFGAENVSPVRNNKGEVTNFVVRDRDGTMKLFDPNRLDWGDIADLGRDAAEVAPGVAAGAAVGTAAAPGPGTVIGAIAGGMAGDTIGSAGTQAIGANLPGSEEHVTTRDRLESGAWNVGAGVLGEGVGQGAKAIFKTAPRAALRSAVMSGGEKATKEGLELEARTGVRMSAPALANTPQARSFEQMLAQRPGTANTIVGANQESARKMGEFWGKTLDAAFGKDIGQEAAGKNASRAYRGAVNSLVQLQDETAEKMFGKVDEIAGNERLVDGSMLRGRLKDMIRKIRPEVHTTGMKAEAGEWEYLLNTIPEDGMMTAQNFKRLLSKASKAAAGSGQIFKDLDGASDRAAAKQFFGVLMDTLDEAVMMPTKGSRLAARSQKAMAALAQARDTYRDMARQIEQLDQLMVQKAFKLEDAGQSEFLARDVMRKTMSDENVRSGMAILEQTDPDAAKSLRRSALDNEFADLAPKSGIPASREVPVDPARYAKWHKEKLPRLQALLGNDKATLAALDDLAEVGRRVGPISSDINSQTSRMFWYKQLYDNFKGGDLSFLGALKTVASLNTAKGLAETLTDPVKRDLFLGIVKPKRGVALNAIKDSVARLVALDQREKAQAEADADFNIPVSPQGGR